MYGMLLESVQYFMQVLYGEDKWHQILATANIKNVIFSTHKRYKNDVMVKLAQACADVIQDRTAEEYLCFFGQLFVEYFTHYGYDTVVRVSGRYYRDFLHGIDNLHETMRFSYPKMLSPSFYVKGEDKNGCWLHYQSKRIGFKNYVIGQLQQCAEKFYNIDVEIGVVHEAEGDEGCHVVFRLDFDNFAYKPPTEVRKRVGSKDIGIDHISGTFFLKVFPFSIIFDRSMQISCAGHMLTMMFAHQPFIGCDVTSVFILRRPQLTEFTWDNIILLQKVVFEIESINRVTGQKQCSCPDNVICACSTTGTTGKTILLKGQMQYIPDIDSIAFLCKPLLANLEELQETGLYINDLNMHDSSREMAMAGWQHASMLEYSIEKQIEKSAAIAQNLQKLDEWKEKSDTLLYSMIPRQTALRLKNGEDPINTCETFDHVTIMFTYLIGFTDLCAKIPPMELVQCINDLFVKFDEIVGKYNVFKVETLGDAVYMVAGGVPDRSPDHAVNVAAVALELINDVTTNNALCNIYPKEELKIRIGMHTGSVVGGVVGRRMPQYCLFGDTVNTASRMQTYSDPGRIHISESCYNFLVDTKYILVYRGTVNVKGKGSMKTYWLLGDERNETTYRQYQTMLKEQQSAPQTVVKTASSERFNMRAKMSMLDICSLEPSNTTIVSTVPCKPIQCGLTSHRHDEITDTVSPSSRSSMESDDDALMFTVTPATPSTPPSDNNDITDSILTDTTDSTRTNKLNIDSNRLLNIDENRLAANTTIINDADSEEIISKKGLIRSCSSDVETLLESGSFSQDVKGDTCNGLTDLESVTSRKDLDSFRRMDSCEDTFVDNNSNERCNNGAVGVDCMKMENEGSADVDEAPVINTFPDDEVLGGQLWQLYNQPGDADKKAEEEKREKVLQDPGIFDIWRNANRISKKKRNSRHHSPTFPRSPTTPGTASTEPECPFGFNKLSRTNSEDAKQGKNVLAHPKFDISSILKRKHADNKDYEKRLTSLQNSGRMLSAKLLARKLKIGMNIPGISSSSNSPVDSSCFTSVSITPNMSHNLSPTKVQEIVKWNNSVLSPNEQKRITAPTENRPMYPSISLSPNNSPPKLTTIQACDFCRSHVENCFHNKLYPETGSPSKRDSACQTTESHLATFHDSLSTQTTLGPLNLSIDVDSIMNGDGSGSSHTVDCINCTNLDHNISHAVVRIGENKSNCRKKERVFSSNGTHRKIYKDPPLETEL